MLALLLVLQLALLLAVAWLLLRRQPASQDPRQLQLPDQILQLQARNEALEATLRTGLSELRRESLLDAASTRDANGIASAQLRGEVQGSITRLGETLSAGLEGFRKDNAHSAEVLRTALSSHLDSIGQRLETFVRASGADQLQARDALHTRLTELASANTAHQERLRTTVGDSLDKLNADNTSKLEEMRATVDEKLHATLHSRLTESFGQVTDQLNKVHTGLGEMSKLSEGVDGLSRIFTNVKSRGGFAEVQLGMLLKQMLAPSQYIENATIKPGTLERVEYAVRFPGHAGERLMPIDAKFPREAWERLEAAYDSNLPDAIQREGRAFESAIRTEAERICSKYINQPVTTPYAIMFLPTEGLYAEVIRREALQAELQSKCHVTIAGPTTLSAILTSFQMGFHMLALQEKGDEVWKVLEGAKTEFGKFGRLMDKVESDVLKIHRTIGEVGVRTRAINRTLREVGDPAPEQGFLSDELESLVPISLVPMLAAQGED